MLRLSRVAEHDTRIDKTELVELGILPADSAAPSEPAEE